MCRVVRTALWSRSFHLYLESRAELGSSSLWQVLYLLSHLDWQPCFSLLNQHLHTFPPPPHLSLPLCVHACMHTRVPDVRNHPQSAAVLVFEVGPQSNTANLFWRFHLCFPRPPHPPGIYMVLGIWNLAFPHAYRASTFPQLRFLCLRCRNLHFPEY